VTTPYPELDARYAAATAEVSSLPADACASARRRAVVEALWRHLAPTGVSWVGFYLAPAGEPATELRLDCREPKPACSPIGMHGVCGQSFLSRTVRIVEDTRDLGGAYVACDPRDRSEIVLPVAFAPGPPTGVLDLDSHDPGRFGPADERGLRAVLGAAGIRVATGT
jgi:putative methionine-R-sulfoxide reductase with GAF domain